MSDSLRQTGRTTKQLNEALEKGAVFVVHSLAMKRAAEHILVHTLKVSPDAVSIVVVTNNIREALRGTTNPVVDHAVWEVGDPKAVEELREALRFVTSPTT